MSEETKKIEVSEATHGEHYGNWCGAPVYRVMCGDVARDGVGIELLIGTTAPQAAAAGTVAVLHVHGGLVTDARLMRHGDVETGDPCGFAITMTGNVTPIALADAFLEASHILRREYAANMGAKG